MQRFLDEKFYLTLYNCTIFNVGNKSGEFAPRESPFGTLFFVIGIISEIIYIPLIFGMLRRKFFEMPFYKINFCLGLVNVVNIFVGSIIGGYLMSKGTVFCMNPNLIYITGIILTGSLVSAYALCAIMGFYQCLEVSRIRMLMTFFGGSKVWVWIALLLIYNIRMAIYEMPLLIDATHSTWSYDPYIGLPSSLTRHSDANVRYANDTNSISVIVIIVVLALENAFLALTICNGASTEINKTERKTMRQTLAICFVCMLAGIAAIYIYNFTSTAAFLATFVLQLNSVFPALVYLYRDDKLRQISFGKFIECCSACKTIVRDAADYSDTENTTNGQHTVVVA